MAEDNGNGSGFTITAGRFSISGKGPQTLTMLVVLGLLMALGLALYVEWHTAQKLVAAAEAGHGAIDKRITELTGTSPPSRPRCWIVLTA